MKVYRLALVGSMLTGCTAGTLTIPDPMLAMDPAGVSGSIARSSAAPTSTMAPLIATAATPTPVPTATPVVAPAVSPTPTPRPTKTPTPANAGAGPVDSGLGGDGTISGEITGTGFLAVIVKVLRADNGVEVARAPAYGGGGAIGRFTVGNLTPGHYTLIPTTTLTTVNFDKTRLDVAITENNVAASARFTLHTCASASVYRAEAIPAEGLPSVPPCVQNP